MSLKVGHEPRIAANTSASPIQRGGRGNLLGNAEAAAPVTLEKTDSILDATWGTGTGVGVGAGLGAGFAATARTVRANAATEQRNMTT